MSTTTQNNAPIDVIRDGSLKAKIWKNTTEKGHFYSVELVRTYKDGEVYKDSSSFSGSDLLRIARLAEIAYSEILIYKSNDRTAQLQAEDKS